MADDKQRGEVLISPNLDPRVVARGLFWQGWKISAIGRQLGIKPATIHSWKQRENWEGGSPVQRVAASVEARLIQLVHLPRKSDGDYKEMRLLNALLTEGGKTGRLERLPEKQVQVPPGKEMVVYEPPTVDDPPRERLQRRDKVRQSERRPKNFVDAEQFGRLQEIFLDQCFGYQRKWNEAFLRQRFRNILKSRQIGATFYFAREAFMDALKTGKNKIFLSASRRQAFQFKRYICDMAAMVDVELSGDAINLPSSGANLYFLGTNSRTAQSYHGDLYADEYFWMPDFKTLQAVAEPMAAQKQYKTTFFSTPSSEAHPAFGFWSGAAYNEGRPQAEHVKLDLSHEALKNGRLDVDAQWRQMVTIHDAQAMGCDLFDIEYLRKRNAPSQFAQLFECRFVADGDAVFDLKLLQSCGVDSMVEWADFHKPFMTQRPLGNHRVWIAYDPNHTGDAAGLVVLMAPRRAGEPFRLVQKNLLPGADFQSQADFIRKLLDIYAVEKIVIDTNGIGAAVGELVRKFFPMTVCMTYTPDIKGMMVMKTLNLMRHGRVQWDHDEIDMKLAFLSVRRNVTASGRHLTYESTRSKNASHGDLAWAMMMGLFQEPLDGAISGGVEIDS